MIPFSFGPHGSPSSVTTAASMPGSGIVAEPGLIGSRSMPYGFPNDRTAGLGLPHVIDDRHAALEDRVLQPVPAPAAFSTSPAQTTRSRRE